MIARSETLPWPGDTARDAVCDSIAKLGIVGSFTMRELERDLRTTLNKDVVHARVSDLLRAGYLTPEPPLKAVGEKPKRLLVNECGLPADIPFTVSARLPMTIPRTFDGLWAMLRWLDKTRGHFGLNEVLWFVKTEVSHSIVRQYIRHLHASGYLTVQTGTLAADGGAIYRISKRQVETPRFKADGEPLASDQITANLWRGMKLLGYFKAEDLSFAASLPELPISKIDARRYCEDLAAAGYLLSRQDPAGWTLYRLRPRMNTGPAAPRLLRARFVWDPNLGQIMGSATSVQEIRL